MFAINVENSIYFFKKKIVFLLFPVSVVINMKKCLKKNNQLNYENFLV